MGRLTTVLFVTLASMAGGVPLDDPALLLTRSRVVGDCPGPADGHQCPPPAGTPWRYYLTYPDSHAQRGYTTYANVTVEGWAWTVYNATHYHKSIGCAEAYAPFDHRYVVDRSPPVGVLPTELSPHYRRPSLHLHTAIMIGCLWCEGFYHSLLESIPRLLDVADLITPTTPILISYPNYGLERLFGYLERVGVSHQQIVGMHTHDVVHVDHLIAPYGMPCGRPRVSQLHQLRTRLAQPIAGAVMGLIVKRHGLREVVNHAAIRAALREQRQDVEWVEFTGSETIERSTELWGMARYVVSPHGAGLSNLVLSPVGVQVIELIPQTYRHLMYGAIAEVLGHTWVGLITPSTSGQHQMTADIDQVLAAVTG